VSASVLQEHQWWRSEVLCQRLVQSCRQQPRRPEVMAAWCQLCWRVPERAARGLDERQSDSKLTALWQRFGDDEDIAVNEAAAEVEWSAAEFPAWLLLHEPSWSQQLPEALANGNSLGEQYFRSVHQWLHARRTGDSQLEIELRRQLRASQPLLFAKLKRTV
jgi:hypothetical protein